jgi:hypothetical protein
MTTPKPTGNPPTLADISASSLSFRRMLKEVWFGVFTIEFQPYAKNEMICLMKSAAWDLISSSTVIPKVSLTSSLIPRVVVVWIKSKRLWVLCISIGNRCTTTTIFKTNTLLGIHARKPGRKEILSRLHGATLAK